jgi:hypothetical protein
MNKLLLNFYNENKKSVIVFTISIFALLLVCLYFYNKNVVLSCSFLRGSVKVGTYKPPSVKTYKITFEDDYYEKTKSFNILIFANQNKIESRRETYFNHLDGKMKQYVNFLGKDKIKWGYNGRELDNKPYIQSFDLNRFTGELNYYEEKEMQDQGLTFAVQYQCSKEDRKF